MDYNMIIICIIYNILFLFSRENRNYMSHDGTQTSKPYRQPR